MCSKQGRNEPSAKIGGCCLVQQGGESRKKGLVSSSHKSNGRTRLFSRSKGDPHKREKDGKPETTGRGEEAKMLAG